MINLQKEKIEEIDEQKLFPLMRWLSGDEANIPVVSDINRKFMYSNKTLLLRELSYRCKNKLTTNKSGQVFYPVKYPKATKYDEQQLEILKNCFKKYYKIGEKDVLYIVPSLLQILQNKDMLQEVADTFGLDNKERKQLGLRQIKFDTNNMKKTKQQSLF